MDLINFNEDDDIYERCVINNCMLNLKLRSTPEAKDEIILEF